jgi:hypothetical protein
MPGHSQKLQMSMSSPKESKTPRQSWLVRVEVNIKSSSRQVALILPCAKILLWARGNLESGQRPQRKSIVVGEFVGCDDAVWFLISDVGSIEGPPEDVGDKDGPASCPISVVGSPESPSSSPEDVGDKDGRS